MLDMIIYFLFLSFHSKISIKVITMQKEQFKVNNGKFELIGEKYIPLSPKGKPIIVCHDLFSNYRELNTYIEYFVEEGYTVYGFDFCGIAKKENQSYVTIENGLKDIQTIINKVDEKKDELTLFGVGHGAFLALLYASKNPAVIAKVLCASPTLSIPDLARKGSLPIGKFNPEDIEKTWKPKLFTKYSYLYAKEAVTIDIDKVLKQVLCPVCMVFGGLDEYVSATYGRKALEELSKDSFVYFIKKAHHTFTLKEEGMAIDYFKEFLKEKRGLGI